jgi:hypothetical protein
VPTNFDPHSLNLHLALQTNEVLGCAEAMWGWVLAYQAREKEREKGVEVVGHGKRMRMPSISVGEGKERDKPRTIMPLRVQADGMTEETRATLIELTRAEFDGLLTQFDL